LPSGYTFVSAAPSTGTWTAPNWTIGTLANGASVTLDIIATVNATGVYANTATISGGQTDPTSGNNSSTVTPIPLTQSPVIAVIKTSVFDDNNGDGFAQVDETISYTFTVMNRGDVALTNVWIDDLLPGIVITGGPISLSVGESNSTAFVGVYTLIQKDIITGSVTNQATVYGTSPLGVVVKDLSDDNSVLEDDSTVLGVNGCAVKVFNAVSPNGDGSNDIFYIRGIECYPNNSVEIYNRWGIKVYDAQGYDNNNRVFRGISEGRETINQSEGLPTGTYFYSIKYSDLDGNGIDKSGYLHLARD
jgi:gliding motility-associated-like protein/uncharacterized repeat protein (TIGR01451 family)